MIETDLLYAFIKKDNWLKAIANKIIKRIDNGEFGIVYVSRECLHELYYVSKEEGVSLDEYIARATAIIAIENLKFLETTYEIDFLALTLMRQYNLKSIFDAYYAATALNQVEDHIIISAADIYDTIPGLKRVDPKKL